MSIFMCTECGCVENTACSNYWSRNLNDDKEDSKPLCSECDPLIGKWHGKFEKHQADLMLVGEDGFLYSEKPHHVDIIGHVQDRKVIKHDYKFKQACINTAKNIDIDPDVQLRLNKGENVSIKEMPQSFRDEIKRRFDSGELVAS
jgi:hypothetical protein